MSAADRCSEGFITSTEWLPEREGLEGTDDLNEGMVRDEAKRSWHAGLSVSGTVELLVTSKKATLRCR